MITISPGLPKMGLKLYRVTIEFSDGGQAEALVRAPNLLEAIEMSKPTTCFCWWGQHEDVASMRITLDQPQAGYAAGLEGE